MKKCRSPLQGRLHFEPFRRKPTPILVQTRHQKPHQLSSSQLSHQELPLNVKPKMSG
jgi:hypothetical protein